MESEKSKNLNQWKPTLPEELIIDILSRLPVKSLLRFRSVSKYWIVLISSPEFVKTHLSVSANNKDYTHHRLLKYMAKGAQFNLQGFCLNPLFNGSVTEAFSCNCSLRSVLVEIVGSVNGLICIAYDTANFFLWNPSMRTFDKLSSCHHNRHSSYSCYYGFGYDEVHDDYKVVSMVGILKECSLRRVEVRMYSLKSGTWSSMDDLCNISLFSNAMGFLVNGKLHWGSYAVDEVNIIYIDLADEKWGKVEKPPREEQDMDFHLGVLRSDLCVIYTCFSNSRSNVWIMKEYGIKKSWTRMYTIKTPYMHQNFSPPFFMSNKGELFLGGVIYSPEEERIRYPGFADLRQYTVKYIYIESLVWPLMLSKRITQQD